MKYRQLGNTGIEVSEIGFGAWGIGGDSYGPTDDAESKLTLETAYANGINFYDTADIYGDGHSEELIGQVFEKVRHEIVIATKGGSLYHTVLPAPQDFSPEHLRSALEASLRRLKTDYIDVYQLHSPHLESIPDALATLLSFRNEGKIRQIGVSLNSPQDYDDAITELAVSVIQTNFSMIDQRALIALDVCEESGVGVIARTPLCFGFLSDVLKGYTGLKMDKDDHRRHWSNKQIKVWAEAPMLFEHIQGSKTAAQLALGFCLSHDAISTTIPGMMHVEEVLENVRSVALSDDEVEEIREIYNNHEFFLGEI